MQSCNCGRGQSVTTSFYNHSSLPARMLAKDGKCKSFDNRADGYSRGEGVGIVVLKSLKKALEDGDRIHAVIRGGAINNDGRTNGITTPNTDAQVSLLKRAYESAKISPQEVPYVEAHGTGTQAGDAAELTAIGSVLGIGRSEHYPPLTIGSVKANFGHTEGAAGVASVIKLCLVLQKRQIPKLVHFQIRNEKVDWENFQINLPTDSVEWPQKSKNVAGCSSFGFGGANAHLVLEAPPNNRKPSQREDDSRNDIYPTVHFCPLRV
ncbi:polyketide synthase 2 [Apostichopus japonicus]|uniref:Polyketide synthase 2 n=1 Tax=Stichopus japonicus TaxID=307972 RepID=A0A2G8JER1_STIJA|nr:polyketide synthase 2 [Apostichopus japonicus]